MDPDCKLINVSIHMQLDVEDGERLSIQSPALRSNQVSLADIEAFIRRSAEEQLLKAKQFFEHREVRFGKFNTDGTVKKAG